MHEVASASRRDLAVQAALGLWLVGWMVKASVLLDLFGRVGLAMPLVVPGMPTALWHPLTPLVAYGLPLLAVPLGIVRGGRTAAVAAGLSAACALLLSLHVAAYNDATFVTAFWAALWVAWLATRDGTEAETWGPRLAQGVIALVFLGGALGKLTPEYLSGEVLYHVYFLQKTNGIYPWLRGALDPEALRSLATVFSWAIITTEAALATSILWRPRLALGTAAVVCVAIVVGSTVYLTSVMAPLVGVCVGGILVARPAPAFRWGRYPRLRAVGIGSPSYAPSPKSAKS